jgi:PPP family 3-phenylpropionic acid transporter
MAQPERQKTFRIEAMYAGLQSTYWLSVCTFSGFMAIYLGYYGFSDTLIGLTSALISIITIVFQLYVSVYSDNHPHIPIKRTAAIIYLGALALVAVLALMPLPILLMFVVYSVAGGLINAIPGLYNALIIQFVNLGIPVNLGWPRGMSALLYAVAAFFLGLVLERFSAEILMLLCFLMLAIALFFALKMQNPHDESKMAESKPLLPAVTFKASFRQLLGASRVLQLFLMASVFMQAGQSNTLLFLPRIISNAGGGKAELGLALLIQVGMEMPGMLLTPLLVRRFRARAVLSISFASYLLKALIVLFSSNMGGVLAATSVSLLCYGLYGISSVYFVNDIVKPHEKVRAQVLVTMSGALAAIVANPLAGFVVDCFGVSALNLVCAICQMLALGLMLLCAAFQNAEEKTPAFQRGI